MEPNHNIVAHFYLSSITANAYDPNAAAVVFQVVSKGEANKAWAAATPSGQLSLTIKNPTAARQFTLEDLGREFEVTITRIVSDDPDKA